ncbi:hypothetical protein HYN46_06480 [Aquirhabdus parva]|uniref:Uncharacterized protein n=2 Tax=Aquirhabdus parva TaxID=2283318 RepID=A0A345P5E5_9GAMM|nr:hypothetical protein HYN46_06480 [Aquirhabdus parva]
MILENMRPLTLKPHLLSVSILAAFALGACQQTPPPIPVNNVPLSAEYNRNLLIPPAAPVVDEDPLALQIKAIDRSDYDGRIALLAKYAKHYPPHFDNKRARRAAEVEAKDLAETLNVIANNPQATHAQLLQGFKANGLARNLDVGKDTTTNANNFMRRALKMKPNDPETNFWFGVLLSEGGGMNEGIPYLNKAAKGGYSEAYLSIANAYLSLNKKAKALSALESYKRLVPDDARIPEMVDAVKTDKASIW